jgi:hypothetical protein
MYVWNPSNFSVNNSANLGGVAASNYRQFNTWQNSHYSGTDGAEYATILFDTNNSAYYIDPSATSRLNYALYDNVYSYGWMQTPIFYDANNNGYYLDPASTSNLNVVYATQYLYASDRRLKDHITPITSPLWKLLQLEGVTFDWKSGDRRGQHDVGVIAQDVEKVLPEAVRTDANGMKAVDYPKLVPLLIASIKEQQSQIDALTKRLEALEAKK